LRLVGYLQRNIICSIYKYVTYLSCNTLNTVELGYNVIEGT